MVMKPYEDLGKIGKYLVDNFFGLEYWEGHVDRERVRHERDEFAQKNQFLLRHNPSESVESRVETELVA